MIIAGIVLWILQIMAFFGIVMSGNFSGGIFNIIGCSIFGIIGSVLLIVGYNKKYGKDGDDDGKDNNKK